MNPQGSEGANALDVGFIGVGFIGVGNMGWPMAANLVNGGFDVAVADARREVANNFVQQLGGTAPDTLAQLAASSGVVVTMLPTSAHVATVLADGADNVLAGLKPGSIVIDMTSGPGFTYSLSDMRGQVVHSGQSSAEREVLDLRSCAAGTYIVQAKDERGRRALKSVVVE